MMTDLSSIHPNFASPDPTPQRPGQKLARDVVEEPSIEELCRPVSAKIMPKRLDAYVNGTALSEAQKEIIKLKMQREWR